MSLQGSIETFAIADVLRLLAATSKSGRLHVQGPSRAGTVWVDNARILGAESPSTPHAAGPADILFQLLRFSRGSFRFELDKYPAEPGEPLDIETTLTEAEAMVVQWGELEPRIVSPDAWVQLAPRLAGPSVTLEAADWTTLVAVSGGRTVAEVGDVLEVGELQTAQALARLLDASLIEISAKAPAGSTRSVISATPVRSTPTVEVEARGEQRNGVASAVERADAPVADDPTAPADPGGADTAGIASGPDAPKADAAGEPTVEEPGAAAPAEPAPAVEPPAEEAEQPEPPSAPSNGSVISLTPTTAAPPVPPAPPAPPVAPVWSPSAQAATAWSSPDFPSLTPPPEPAPPAPVLSDALRAEAGLLNPKAAGEAEFLPPPETDLDGTAPDPFSYVPSADRSDVYSYPPMAEPPPVWEPSADKLGANGTGTTDNGYPPLPPPLPPVYGTSSAVPTLPPTPPSWSSAAEPKANGSADAPVAKGDAGLSPVPDIAPPLPPKPDTWIGPLADAIAKADTPAGETPSAAPATSGPDPVAPPAPAAPPIVADITVPPPPPAPPAPVGAWSSPASLFEAGNLPERLAPPPPPPPPPVATALQGLADPALSVSPTLLTGAVTLTDNPSTTAADLTEDADDIERQLFNLSPRAREAVKQSSGLYDGRGRR
ncbi:MAG: DUF4388 domain-containing protein [Acidimicrobiales bacterium]|nr:DUF4388 domain-containing protein [Acidimicrobiales bacterium]